MTQRARRTWLAVVVTGLALAVARPALVAAKGPSEGELLSKIEKGGTANDHAALASFYRDQAKAAAQKATDHEAMAVRFAPAMKTDWATHCRSLASYYRKLSEEYEAMAKLHEGHAAELRKKE